MLFRCEAKECLPASTLKGFMLDLVFFIFSPWFGLGHAAGPGMQKTIDEIRRKSGTVGKSENHIGVKTLVTRQRIVCLSIVLREVGPRQLTTFGRKDSIHSGGHFTAEALLQIPERDFLQVAVRSYLQMIRP